MKTIIKKLFTGYLMFAALILAAACSDWNELENVDIDSKNAQQQNPELWARYMEALRTYKQSKHFIAYGSFDNGAEQSKNEGNYLRSLPDSLDFVVLNKPENITAFDLADIPLLQEKSIRVLYLVDYASQTTNLSDANKLSAYLDKAVAAATQLNLDGFAFTGMHLYSGTEQELIARREAAKLIVSKLYAKGKTLVLQGDPAFVEVADYEKLNYVALNTENITNITEVKLHVMDVLTNSGLPKEKLLLSARINFLITNETNVKQDAATLLTDRVVSLGPVGGLAIYSMGEDYYHAKMNYEIIRTAIHTMNPSN